MEKFIADYEIPSNVGLREDLQKVLRASVFVNEDDHQVRAAHKILGYTPVQKSFPIPKHVIRANNPRLQKITVTKDGFLFPEEPSDPEVVNLAVPSSSHVFAEAAKEDLEQEEEAFDVFDQLDQSKDPPGDLGDPCLTEADLLASEASPLPTIGYKRKPHTSLLDLIEGQPEKSQQKLPPPPPKTQSVQTRSTSAQQRLPPPPPPPPSQTSLPSGEEALAAKEEAETAAYAEGVAEIEALYKAQVPGAALDGAEAGEVVEEVGAAEPREDPSEEAPQEVAEVPSDAQIPTTEEAAILAVPL
nr:uncharacterized protein LOC112031655 [Quercus suber]